MATVGSQDDGRRELLSGIADKENERSKYNFESVKNHVILERNELITKKVLQMY